MSFTIPNPQDAAYRAQSQVDSVDLAILVLALAGTGISNGCAVSAQSTPNMTVAITSGAILSAGTSANVSGGNVTIAAADNTFNRFDLIVASNAGALSAVQGTPSATPQFPSVPSGSVALGAVYIPAGATSISASQIIDKRAFIAAAVAQTRPRIFVAAADANSSVKAKADYVCTGASNNPIDDVTISAALTAAAATNGLVELSEGDFYLGASLSITKNYSGLWGQGWNTNLSVKNALNDYAIKFNPAANTSIFGALFRDFKISANGNNQTTGGGGIKGFGAVQCSFEHLYIDIPWEAAIKLDTDGNAGTGHHNRVLNCQITNGQSSNGGNGWGVWCNASDENYIAHNDFESMGRSGGTDPAAIRDLSGLQLIDHNVFVGCTNGVKVQGNDTQITNNKFDGCKQHNVQVNGNRTMITANVFYQFGFGSSSAIYDAINVDNVQRCTIANNSFLTDSTGSRSGVNLANGSDFNTVTANTFDTQGGGYGTAAIIMSSASPDHNIVKDNQGFKTSNSGTATVSAATSIVVTHGLGATPARVFIYPTSDPGAGIRHWRSAVGSTTFTITFSASASFSFDWKAQVLDG